MRLLSQPNRGWLQDKANRPSSSHGSDVFFIGLSGDDVFADFPTLKFNGLASTPALFEVNHVLNVRTAPGLDMVTARFNPRNGGNVLRHDYTNWVGSINC